MPLDLNRAEDRKKVSEAATRSYSDLQKFRDKRQAFIKEFAGQHFFDGQPETIVPLIFELVETLVQKLVANNPRVTCETDFSAVKPEARLRGLVINKRLKEICFDETLREVLMDAVFGMGIAETHNGESYPLDFGEYGSYDPGLPTVCRVPFDDFFWDSSASSIGKARFVGKYMRADLDALKQDMNLDKKTVDALAKVYTNEPTRDGTNLLKSENQGEGKTADLLTPGVDLVCLYLPYEARISVLAKDNPDMPPLRWVKWTGGKKGPFRLLSLSNVPDQVMALSPVAVVETLHRLVNRLYTKLSDQANTQKNVTAFTGAAKDDAQRLKDARNNESIHAAHLEGIKMFSTPGPDQGLQSFLLGAENKFNEGAGNLRVMAGLAPQADTYGQEQLLFGAASQREAKMLQRVLDFVTGVVEDLACLLVQNQFYERDLFVRQGELTHRYPWRPGKREGKDDQFLYQVAPYSMMYVNPSQKFQGLTQYLLTVRAPLLQFGDAFDLGSLDEMAAEYMNEPRLREICNAYTQLDPMLFAGKMGLDLPEAGKPNGNYTRRNVRSPGGDDYATKQLQQALVGGGTQSMNQAGGMKNL